MSQWTLVVGGGLLLYFGADLFVVGAARLALALKVPQLLVGLTVVAHGTSAPEVIVGIEAAGSGHGELALGNVIGSNVANIGLVLGVSAMIAPAVIDDVLRRRELPVLVGTALLVPLVLLDGCVQAWEGGLLLALGLGYTWAMIRAARAASIVSEARSATRIAEAAAGAPRPKGGWRAALESALGLLALLTGGSLFVDGAIGVAREQGVSERLTGLTLVALGTSLPELVTSLVAAHRGHSDLAVGNVLGSNIFNVLLCLGAAALAGTIKGTWSTVGVDVAALLVLTAVAAVFIRTARTMSRREGAVALGLYLAYLLATFLRG